MKTNTLVKQYRNLVEKADEYFRNKVDLTKIVNEYFNLIVVDVIESPIPKMVRLMIDSVNEQFDFLNIHYFDADPNEMDYFFECEKKGIKSGIKRVEADEVKQFEPEPLEEVDTLCEDCGEIHEVEKLEGH